MKAIIYFRDIEKLEIECSYINSDGEFLVIKFISENNERKICINSCFVVSYIFGESVDFTEKEEEAKSNYKKVLTILRRLAGFDPYYGNYMKKGSVI